MLEKKMAVGEGWHLGCHPTLVIVHSIFTQHIFIIVHVPGILLGTSNIKMSRIQFLSLKAHGQVQKSARGEKNHTGYIFFKYVNEYTNI